MRSSLETGALVDGALLRESSHRLWCLSVMAVQEKCDEKIGVVESRLARRATGLATRHPRDSKRSLPRARVTSGSRCQVATTLVEGG
jgi:hypothetical protein